MKIPVSALIGLVVTGAFFLMAIFAPLLGFIIAGLAGKRLSDSFSQAVTCGLMGVAFVGSALSLKTFFFGMETLTIPLATWMQVGDFPSIGG